MSNVWETFEHAGCRVEIVQDEDPTSPRDACNVGVMLASLHRRYTLGDAEFVSTTPEYEHAAYALNWFCERRRGSLFARWARCFYGATVVLPLYLLDHSGLAMRTGPFREDPGSWDSGIVGFTFDTPRTRKETGVELADIEQALTEEVACYDAYLQGQVVGFVVTALMDGACGHADCDEHQGWEEVEDGSCWGFLISEHERDLGYVREEARAAAEAHAESLAQGRA